MIRGKTISHSVVKEAQKRSINKIRLYFHRYGTKRFNKRYGTTILMVTHDLTLVNKHRKRTVVLEHGHIVADLAQGGYVRHDQ